MKGDLSNEHVEDGRLEREGVVCDIGLLGEHDGLGGLGVRRQEAPIDKPAVPEVRVVTLLRRQLQDTLNHVLFILICVLIVLICFVNVCFIIQMVWFGFDCFSVLKNQTRKKKKSDKTPSKIC